MTKEAEQNIKRAAKVKNDLPLLCQIQDVDLIAKELKIHKRCYLEYTCILDSTVEKATEQLPRQLRDIKSVKTFINEAVLEQSKLYQSQSSTVCMVLDTNKKMKKNISK